MKNKSGEIICMLFAMCLLMAVPVGTVTAQTADNSMAVGLGVGAFQIPGEGDFSADGTPIDLFFDWNFDKNWLKFRFGYNASQTAIFEFDKFDKTIKNTLTSNTLYVAYRYTYELIPELEFFGVGGLAMISSELKVELSGSSLTATASASSYMLGGGAVYFFGDIGVVAQVNVFSGEADFDGAKLAVGSTQLQLGANYGF